MTADACNPIRNGYTYKTFTIGKSLINGTNPGNLTLRAKDKNTGLSFSTIPPINNKTAAVTTIEEVNSTGNLIAVQDGPSHVSIKPRNGTMSDWIKAGTNSIWTKNIKANCKTVSEVTFL